VAFNVLDFPRDRFLKRRAEFLVGELIRFFQETWNKTDAFGPMFETYFRNALRLMIHQESRLLTLMDFERVFADREFRKELLNQCTDDRVRRFWTDLAEKTGGEASLANVAPYITSKVSILTQSGFVSDLIGQPKDELLLEERINRGGIILVNLNKGLLGTNESRLLGVLLTMQIFAAGLKRSILPVRERRPVNVYVDEFQNFVSDNVASMLSEARKFGLRMNLANQTLSQLNAGGGNQNLLETVLGNVGNMIVFRLGVPDAERLKPFLKPFTPEQIQEMPNYHALVRLLDQEGPIGPFVMKTLPA
jgi:DNA helicase HerA-like ATPase